MRGKGRLFAILALAAVASAGIVAQQGGRPMSGSGTSSVQMLGHWVTGANPAYTLGRGSYGGGSWIGITYGRPLKRGRDLWGTGANYGAATLVGAPIWRAGADVTTQLKTEIPLVIGDKTLTPGTYTMFIDLKENHWTLVLSTLKAQSSYDPTNKVDTYGAYNYVPSKDVVRVPMKLETLPHSFEQLSWEVLDVSDQGGLLALLWDHVLASVPFTVVK